MSERLRFERPGGVVPIRDVTPILPLVSRRFQTRYVISQTESAHQTNEPDDLAREQLLAIADRVTQIAMDAEIVPGIRALPAPGHSPGQIALMVESNGERLLHLADVFHHPIQLLDPDWYFDFDTDPAMTVATRQALLDGAARERLRVLSYHLAFPGLGQVVPDGTRWQWVPAPA